MELRRYTILGFFALSIVILCGSGQARAADENGGPASLSSARLSHIESNLIVALESSSPTLQASAAQVIRDIKARVPDYGFERSVIPLMRILKDERQELGVRQMAALTLHEIDSGRGDFAIEREAKFSEQHQLKRLCAWLTYAKVNGDLAAINASNSASPHLITANK